VVLLPDTSKINSFGRVNENTSKWSQRRQMASFHNKEDNMKRSMAFILIQCALFICLAVSGAVAADNGQNNSQNVLALPELIQQAMERNPAIIAAKNKWESGYEIIEARRALPDPQVSYTYFVESVETRVGPQENIFGAKQKFPFYGKRALKAEVAAKEAEALKASYEVVKQEVVRQVKLAFYDLFYVSTIIDITNDEKEILRRFEQIATIKYETGKGSQQNILKVQVEISRLQDKLLTLASVKQTVDARLNTLMDRLPDTPLGKPMQPKFRDFFFIKQQLFRIARENRPELKRGDAWIEKSNRVLSLAKKDYYPDLTVGANYIDVDEGPLNFSDNGKDAFNVMVSVNVPIWRKKLSAQVSSASKMIKARKNVYQNILNQTLFEVEDNLFKIRTARETFNLYRNALIPQAEQSLRSAEAGYVTGIVNFLDLLDAERVLLKIQFGHWKAYTDYLKRIADMERAVGTELAEVLPKEAAPEVKEE
jgi:outer membrane protein TolC